MLYGQQGMSLVRQTSDGNWQVVGRSDLEIYAVKKELKQVQRDFPVLYSGSDIAKIARAEELNYHDELINFKRAFFDDKGKAFYILK